MVLEWVRDGYNLWAKKGPAAAEKHGAAHWVVGINLSAEYAYFFAVGNEGKFTSLAEAKAWCQAQEDAAAPALPLPKSESIWGPIGQGSEWVFVDRVAYGVVEYLVFGNDSPSSKPIADWHAWVRETGAVDLIAERAELVRRMEAAEHQRNLWEQDSRSKAKEADDWKRRTEVAEASFAIAAGERDYFLEQRDDAEARGNEMLAKAAQLRDECDKACKRVEAAEKEVQGVIDHMPQDCVVQVCEGGGPENIFATLAVSASKLRNRAEAAEKERDESRAAKEHLLAVLRRICEYRELLDSASRDVYGQIGDIETMAREAVNKEGGGNG